MLQRLSLMQQVTGDRGLASGVNPFLSLTSLSPSLVYFSLTDVVHNMIHAGTIEQRPL